MSNTASRKWLLTINNPKEHGFTHEHIRAELGKLKSVNYWCLSDEIGEEGTEHTHIFIQATSPIRFNTLKNRFPIAHIDQAKGSSQQLKDYVFKQGKWMDDNKHETNLPETHEEWGEMKEDRQGARTDYEELYDLIVDGKSNHEIIQSNPRFITRIADIDRARQTILEQEARGKNRAVTVVYVYGPPGTGKTTMIHDKYGYLDLYRVTNYERGGFDAYGGQKVIALDEFASSFSIFEMNHYLDKFPVQLPCRYINKWACYDIVYIISNLPLEAQYPDMQRRHPDIWQAFLRRIHTVIVFTGLGEYKEYSLKEYLSFINGWQEIPNTGDLPF